MVRQPTTRLEISGYRFLMRRLEGALLRRDIRMFDERLRARSQAMVAGGVLATVVVAGCAVLAFLWPQPALGNAPIVMGRQSGALYVRVGETLHPVLNLASARLIAATNADPQPVRESELAATKRGPLLGIPGAPQLIGRPISEGESAWTVCDDGVGGSLNTTMIVGPVEGLRARRLAAEQAVLATPDAGATTYLLYQGRRAIVNLADPAVTRALRLENLVPRPVSRSLLKAIFEAPPIAAPWIPDAGSRGPAALSAFRIGSVLRVARTDGDEYYVVLGTGVQRVGQVAADLVRLTDAHGSRTIISVAPDVIRSSRVLNALPVSTFPDRPPTPVDDGTQALCANWTPAESSGADVSLLAGGGLPLPTGQAPMTLSQADGNGPAVDAVYVPPGRSAYVRSTGLAGGGVGSGTRYLVADTGVRFAVHDDVAARDLGLPTTPMPAPWPVLSALPSGAELSRENASVARDTASERPRPR